MPCESARSSFDSSRFSSTMDKGASESPPVSLRVDGPDVSAEPSLPSPKMNAAGALSALGPPPTALQSVTPGLNIAVPPFAKRAQIDRASRLRRSRRSGDNLSESLPDG